MTGVAVDIFIGAIPLFGSYPFALGYLLLPKSTPALWRHIYTIVAAFFLVVLVFEQITFIKMISMSLLTYQILNFYKSTSGVMPIHVPIVIFFGNMGYLSWNLLSSQILHSETTTFDQTIPLMVLTIKLTSFGWAVYDGTRPEESLSAEQTKFVIKELPDLLEYMGYLFFFPSFMVGPAIELRDYQAFIHGLAPFDKRPSTLVPTLKKLGVCIVYMVVYLTCLSRVPISFTKTPEFAANWLPVKFAYVFVAGFVQRFKYYTAWSLTDGSSTLVGFGYSGFNPKTNKHEWLRARNVDVYGLELAENMRGLLESWNMKTANWLRSSVYLRLMSFGKEYAFLATFATFITSSFWHGFHPGYYLTFASGSLVTMVARLSRRHLRPLFMSPSKWSVYKPIYDWVGWFCTVMVVDYIVIPFILFRLDDSITAWKALYFIPHVGMIVFVAGFEWLAWGKYCKQLGKSLGVEEGVGRDGPLVKKLSESHAHKHGSVNGIVAANGLKKVK
ncbi:hypothetical protein SmJEL517_g00445 [Synchytrium microbalum]|uniref:Uncharacterized protein n=1 Tax=Synchytrium microbalum TaxID=1806994 RepID=A0A507C837_9FUNG|nr:uncharacterized protein SmJEL517_g00445 [Synchytrium microbalum]TPX37750.1 hypothetical protein SmJEL517_g00445 [Synchytrium microbalum]